MFVSLNALTEEIVAYEKESDDTHAVKSLFNVFIIEIQYGVSFRLQANRQSQKWLSLLRGLEAMRNAIEAEFGGSKHRLCMWHITQKLPAKICAKIYDETDFKEKLNKIVWNMYIGPEEFEYRWGKLMEEFKLENHKWLTKMFNIRSTWIPAYFIDSPLCGLMRTTSRRFVEKLKSLKKEVEVDCPNPPSKNKTDNLEQLVGVPKPAAVHVNNPTVGSKKGQKKLRIKGGKEKSIEKSLKGRNSCSLCGGTDHNKRTCPGRFEDQNEVVVQKEVGQEEVQEKKIWLQTKKNWLKKMKT
ncbi:FAR1-related sequence 5-like protein [Tanacetum coccineum]